MNDILVALMGVIIVVGSILSVGFILVMMERGRQRGEINEIIKQIYKDVSEHEKKGD